MIRVAAIQGAPVIVARSATASFAAPRYWRMPCQFRGCSRAAHGAIEITGPGGWAGTAITLCARHLESAPLEFPLALVKRRHGAAWFMGFGFWCNEARYQNPPRGRVTILEATNAGSQ